MNYTPNSFRENSTGELVLRSFRVVQLKGNL